MSHGSETLGWVGLAAGQAIATSEFGRRQWTNGDGAAVHHLIDPSTGAPGPRVHATVLADDPVTGDVTAKVLALCPERLEECSVAALLQSGGLTVPGAHARSPTSAQVKADAELRPLPRLWFLTLARGRGALGSRSRSGGRFQER
jgi:thiamine biosynthesis lipoprotein ApbE